MRELEFELLVRNQRHVAASAQTSFTQRGPVPPVFRVGFPFEIKSFEGSGAAPGSPELCHQPRRTGRSVTGPTGSGKSTTPPPLPPHDDKINASATNTS